MITKLQSFRLSVALAVVLGIAAGMLVISGLEAQQVSPDTKPENLAEGEFVWEPEAAPDGPIVVLVSLNQQRAYVYRNGILIGYTNVSTGKPGHETPTGVFTILQKDKDHVSSIYKAKMPYTERLTWSGICLHAGGLPGYPSSHGCIHLPLEFSQLLYDIEHLGATVVIADEHSGPEEAAHPAILLSPMMHEQRKEGPAAGIAKFEWEPERSIEGPMSLLLSTADEKLFVYRNGIEIGFAEIVLLD
ncbi:MAG: L,D-transpeptidase family protein, partial [Thermoanaerobaculia bacterium]